MTISDLNPKKLFFVISNIDILAFKEHDKMCNKGYRLVL
jgi:hypothetical protein